MKNPNIDYDFPYFGESQHKKVQDITRNIKDQRKAYIRIKGRVQDHKDKV